MKKRLVSTLLILCFILSAFALSSCGKDEKPAETTSPETESASTEPTGTDAETGEATTAEVTTDKWEPIGESVQVIVEKDRKLRIELSNHTTAEKSSKNDIYLKGPDAVVDGETPLIQVMVFERNNAAHDLLGTSAEYSYLDEGFDSLAERIDVIVKGNASDAPDLFVNMIYELNREVLNSGFKDIWSIPNSFFDFSAEGWLKTWMENLSFSGDRAYILGSDYFLDVFRAIPVLPFNVTMMDDNAARLAPAILGEGVEIGAGEELSARFFDLVEEGNWTWDVLGALSEAIWLDIDGDDADSIRDRLGIIADEFGEGGQCACSFIYSCGEELTVANPIEDPSSAYNGKQWVKYADTSAGLNRIFDAVKSVIEGPGTLSTNYTHAGNSPEEPGIAYHQTKFAAGELLFAGAQLLGALEDEVFQQMTDLYSVVPCPKTDASKSYNTIVYSTGDVGAINVNANPRRARALSAYLQYCTEHSPAIREQFLQIVMKYKVTTYNQGTDRMLDLIYNSILYGRDKIVDDVAGVSSNRWHSYMRKQHFQAGSDFIATQYASCITSKQSALSRIMQKWYTLPKVEPTGN
ncbi:MAG: hypothetical protein IKP55_07660 [Clostridia bacterium]|nr:hypothetical protein [Clostridia bacterium]